MDFDVETLGGALIWVVMMALAGFAFYRAKTRRRHIGSGAAGTIYDMLNEEKRNAIEVIVEDRAAERDEEHADDDVDPPSLKLRRASRTEKGRDR
jgi:hypothetical protein